MYEVSIELLPEGNEEKYCCEIINPTGSDMVLISDTVSDGVRNIVVETLPSGTNPYTTPVYTRQAGEESVAVVVKNPSGETVGSGSKSYG